MDPRHKTVLKKVRPKLLEDLEVLPVLTRLLAGLILTQDDYDQVMAEKTRGKQAECLLNVLPRRGPDAFNEFIQCIGDEQEHLRKALKEALEHLPGI